MHYINADNASAYLAQKGWLRPGETADIKELPGGVSNLVLHVARDGDQDFVLKQARPQLRVEADWRCAVERVWREIDVLNACGRLLAPGVSAPSDFADAPPDGLPLATPDVLHVDRDNFAFAMTAAPLSHRVWRSDLLEGVTDQAIAQACGRLLGRLHAASWLDAELAATLEDRQFFDDLRLAPYYRHLAERHPDFAPQLERLIDSVWQHRLCLVHADFSPKNLLVWPGGLLLVDFETGHFGDPAFDLGFFLSHLVLKAFHRPHDAPRYLGLIETFWMAYQTPVIPRIGGEAFCALVGRAVQNFAGCAWARLDGKSPVDYLTDPQRRHQLRALCQNVLKDETNVWPHVAENVARFL